MPKNTGKKLMTQGNHREFYLDLNVATLRKSSCVNARGIPPAA